jgi:VanZ family protein
MPARRSSAVLLAWLYAALIVYASLYPFTGWTVHPHPPWAWLFEPWTRWWTAFDLVANLLGYLPLGALVFGAWVRSGGRAGAGALAGCAWPTLLSLALETAQNFVPGRVPSTMDLALNAAGASAGVALGLLVHAFGGLGHWQSVRTRWLVEPSAGGLVLLLAWPVALLFPSPLPFGLGQLIEEARERLGSWLEGTAAEAWAQDWLQPSTSWVALAPATEALAVALGVLAPAAVLASVSRRGLRRLVLLAALLAVGIGATTLSTALNFGPQHALAWLSPTAVVGVAAGAVLALAFVPAPVRVTSALGLVVVSALIVIVAQAPADPYFAESLQAWEQGRFIRFHGAAQWVGWFWPYAALAYLLARVAGRAPD